jgi:hypothetical protein
MRDVRHILGAMSRIVLVVLVVLLGVPAGALHAQKKAEGKVAGTYQVKFEEVSSNCQDTGMSLDRTQLEVTQPGARRVAVSLPMVPLMKGVVGRGGKFKAEAKKGKTAIQGVEGRFSIAGRAEGGKIQVLLIAEYFQGDKPLCTQSWNGSGTR